jgi:hypothetical protein
LRSRVWWAAICAAAAPSIPCSRRWSLICSRPLWKTHRWVEAYDAYTEALARDGSNAIASTGAAKVLLRCVARGLGDKHVLQSVAARHIKNARLHPERIAELAGVRAQEQLSKLLQKPLRGGKPPDLSQASEYEKFVLLHRLALSPTVEGLNCSLKRWDSLRIGSIAERVATENGVPCSAPLRTRQMGPCLK